VTESPDTGVTSDELRLMVNGRERVLPSGQGILDLLGVLDCHPQTVAIEYNGEILPKSKYAETLLADGDQLEVVRFVQGG